jgi:alpha-L-fucosidase
MKGKIVILFASFLLGCNSLTDSANKPGRNYKPAWESLSQYKEAPEWFRDAKFGIWAHWGPQCQPGQGDWYARGMYEEGSDQYKWHCANYGHPSEFGFKDVINQWKAEKWNPGELVALYKEAGAKYFFAMGNHHDNFDLWDSKHHPWNAVNMGPKRDILFEWKQAAKANNLYFGVSIHSAHAWTFYEKSQLSDSTGIKKGVAYDGKLTKKEGKGKWWNGYDVQDLYVQKHALSEGTINKQWDWGDGTSKPSKEYCNNFLKRNIDMIDKYNPDMIYYDDSALPLWPVSDVGLKAVSYFYNKKVAESNKINEAVVFAKMLNEEQKECVVWDIEKGVSDTIQDKPWQTCACIGNWHYDNRVYENNWYKPAKTVIHMLIDIVSKNGNLLLSVPIRGDGSIDDIEKSILKDITAWMNVNQGAIFGTRPWKISGEGENIRFVTKDNLLFAHVLSYPEDGTVLIKSLAANSPLFNTGIKDVCLLGSNNKCKHRRTEKGLMVELPKGAKPNDISLTLQISIEE